MSLNYSYVANAEAQYVDQLYQKYQQNPDNVEEGWRLFFEGFSYAQAQNGHAADQVSDSELSKESLAKEFAVLSIIHGFRDRGHLLSTTNPIRQRRDRKPRLDLEDYGLNESDLDQRFVAGKEIGRENATLREIIDRLHEIYCGNIGFEYSHIEERSKRMWLRKMIESHDPNKSYGLTADDKKRILDKLNGAEVFERFLHTKYVGQKRFSLEGGEGTIAALDAIINKAAKENVEEIIIGMAHRGRLNVLANIMGKTYAQIFNEFEGNVMPDQSFGDGDVKYHLGFSSIVPTTEDKEVHLKLVPNPSHLESVDPVVQGYSRAKADLLYDHDYDKILPILIHGDAALAGQGVVFETAQMSKLDGYYTGGTLHFVINNQIGFTTDFDDARSSTYSTGAANMIQAPVFHVNGDDPEALVFAVRLATLYRQRFNNDVFVDMVCYRKHGHNEGDDPKFTQPGMYEIIKKHPSPREVYSKKLIEHGEVEKKIAEDMEDEFWSYLQDRLQEVKQNPLPYSYQDPEQQWRQLRFTTDPKDFHDSPKTGIDQKKVAQILDHLSSVPEGIEMISKMKRVYKGQQKLLDNNELNWGLAELLAYGSILIEGKNVRMSGQDVKRGTFSHRHSMLHDQNTYEEYNRLDGLQDDQGKFMIYNSLLSEFAVLGFEYGYSMASPQTLTLWEAQFGDFYNGAQVMVDQYIVASETKWKRMSGLVMLLPHGYEGQGPEHSSARLERFLQASADYNLTVANLTTPANLFHAFRRQLARDFRKPLIIMSPKSLLRHPKCVSPREDFYGGTKFQEVIDDSTVTKSKAKRLLLCSGKIYYDLEAYREEEKIKDTAIVRLEQLYPYPEKQLQKMIKKYPKAELSWVQEEPRNMGAASYIFERMNGQVNIISRDASASTATGYKKVHDKQQEELVARAFGN
ncbi:MAG TPA: 2-oxoglutarate dehydrogenase E1 component [Saprospiraceae bacterium]|nr:2-oxoglutarate dehydrogenase E1 component [Saprospiraceae bacterium]